VFLKPQALNRRSALRQIARSETHIPGPAKLSWWVAGPGADWKIVFLRPQRRTFPDTAAARFGRFRTSLPNSKPLRARRHVQGHVHRRASSWGV